MRLPLPTNRRRVAMAFGVVAALGAAGVALLRGGDPAPTSISTDAASPAKWAVSPRTDQSVFHPAPSLSSFPATPGAPLPIAPAGAPPVPDSNADSDPDSPDPDDPAAPPAPITLEEYLRHGSKEPLVPPVLHVEAKPAPGGVATSEPLVPPVLTAIATPMDAPTHGAAADAPLVPPVVVAAPPAPR